MGRFCDYSWSIYGLAHQHGESVVLQYSIVVQAPMPAAGKERMDNRERRLVRRMHTNSFEIFTHNGRARNAPITGQIHGPN